MKRTPLQNILLFVVASVLLSLLVLSCGGGSDDDIDQTPAPKFPPVVFIADKNVDGINELFAAFDDGADIIKLSGTMTSGENVTAFAVSPDGLLVAYLAGQNINDQFELYVVPADGGAAIRVSGLFQDDSDVQDDFKWSPDGSLLAYRANRINLDNIELFTVQPDGSNNLRVSISLFATGNVTVFKWAPNSGFIAYNAQRTNLVQLELYNTRPGNQDNIPISRPPPAGGSVQTFDWAPDSTRIAYLADLRTAGKDELFSNTPNGRDRHRISGDFLTNDEDVFGFAWAPDSSLVAYTADQLFDTIVELFVSPPDTNDRNPKVSGATMAGTGVADSGQAFGWAPDSSRIAYIADQDTAGILELYTSTPDGLDNDLVSDIPQLPIVNRNVRDFQWQPSSTNIAYVADQDTDGKFELYVSPNDSNIGNLKVSGTTMAGTGLTVYD
jgi:hypothetical protein